jgi:lysophospholipase L1-like esterase
MNSVAIGIAINGLTVLGLTLAVLATLVVGLEAILRLSEKLNLTDTPNQNAQPSRTTDEETIELNSAIQKLSELHGHPNGLHLKSVNFNSPKFNIVNGWRSTTDQPAEGATNLYLFGGSTIQCLEVQDRDTICSNLQRLLNSTSELIKVNNRGVSGMTVKGNKFELSKQKLEAGDIVIVYFGVNDSKLNVYSQIAIVPFNLIPGYIKSLGFLRIKFKLRVAEWIWRETVKPADRTLRTVERYTQDIESTLIEMNQQTLKSGATFFALLQPNIFTKRSNTVEEFEMIQRGKTKPQSSRLQDNHFKKAGSCKDCPYRLRFSSCEIFWKPN